MKPVLRSLRGGAGLALLPILIGVLVIVFASTAQIRITNVFFINMIVVLGLQVTMGNSNVANLGHITFMGIAAYIAAILVIPVAIKITILRTAPFGLSEVELSAVLAALIAVAMTTAIAFLVGLVITRQSGIAGTIVTLAWLVIVHVVIVNWIDLTRGPRALYGIPVNTSIVWLMFISAAVVIVARLFPRLEIRHSAPGIRRGHRRRRGHGRQHPLASAHGLDPGRRDHRGGRRDVRLPDRLDQPKSFYFEATFLTLAMLILGGMRSVSGAVIGAIVVTVGFEIMRYFETAPEILGLQLPQIFGLTGFSSAARSCCSWRFAPTVWSATTSSTTLSGVICGGAGRASKAARKATDTRARAVAKLPAKTATRRIVAGLMLARAAAP